MLFSNHSEVSPVRTSMAEAVKISHPEDIVGSLFSNLPTEIVISILHEACRISPNFCLSLSQTSIWTRRLAMPHLYFTIIITKLPTAYSILKILEQPVVALSDSSFIPAPHVRSLWIGPASKKTVDIFIACKSLTHVALQEDNFYWLIHSSTQGVAGSETTIDTISSKPDLELFILNARKPFWHASQLAFLPPAPSSPFFAKIRRLWLGKTGAYDSGGLYLQHFTRLTHVAVPYLNPSIQRLPSILRLMEHPGIVCIVVVLLTDLLKEASYDEGLNWVIETRKLHPKLLVLPLRHESLRTHWEEALCPGQSVWEKAAVFTNLLDISQSDPDSDGSYSSD